MEKLIQDKQAALLHLLQHVGLSQVIRDGVTRKFYDYNHYQVLLNLLMEKGSPAPLREKFAYLSWAKPANVRNFLYEYGDPRSAAAVEPGQIMSFWNKSGKLMVGVALKVNAQGAPLEYVVLEERSYTLFLELVKEEVPTDMVYEIFEPYTTARNWAPEESAAAFYSDGTNDSLRRLLQLQGANPNMEVKIGGTAYSLSTYTDTDLFRHLALHSPLEFRSAFFINSFSKLSTICRFFGDGLKNYTDGDQLRYGTILFLKDQGMGVLLLNSAAGIPAIMLSLSQNSYRYMRVKKEEIISYWYPSTEPFPYVPAGNPAYTDLNGFIRHLVLGWHLKGFGNKPLFKSPLFLNEKYLSANFISLLKQGPDKRSEWHTYLSAKGKGLQSNATEIAPGDLLFFATENGINPAIAIQQGDVMYFSYDYEQLLTWVPRPKDLLYVWKTGSYL